jgi:hypothetical protein
MTSFLFLPQNEQLMVLANVILFSGCSFVPYQVKTKIGSGSFSDPIFVLTILK